MTGYYGKHFLDMWADADISVVKRVWAKELGGMSREELARGADACRTLKFPPTLPEFLALCRPPLDYEAAFHEAVRQMHLRRNPERSPDGRTVSRDCWSRPAIYWAAVAMGSDLNALPYAQLKGRWKDALDTALKQGDMAVPPYMVPLPAPGRGTPSEAAVRHNLAQIREKLGTRPGQASEISDEEFERRRRDALARIEEAQKNQTGGERDDGRRNEP